MKNILKSLKINESVISTFLGGLVVIVIGVLIFNYFSSINKGVISEQAPVEITPSVVGQKAPVIVEEDGVMVPQGLPTMYKVEKGDNLWKIAEKFYNSGYNWTDIAKENGMKNPGSIEIGMDISIPKVEVKMATVLAATVPFTKASNGEVIKEPVTINTDSYTTVKGDYLWDIAVRAYGDGYAWTKIYVANREKIGNNPSKLYSGIELTIPKATATK